MKKLLIIAAISENRIEMAKNILKYESKINYLQITKLFITPTNG